MKFDGEIGTGLEMRLSLRTTLGEGKGWRADTSARILGDNISTDWEIWPRSQGGCHWDLDEEKVWILEPARIREHEWKDNQRLTGRDGSDKEQGKGSQGPAI